MVIVKIIHIAGRKRQIAGEKDAAIQRTGREQDADSNHMAG